MPVKPLLVVALATLTSALSARAQVTAAQLEAICESALDSFEVPGMAVCVVQDGEVLLSRGFGVTSLDDRVGDISSVDEHTLFAIASTTKAFVGTSIALLDHEGALSLEDAVTDHLPWLAWTSPATTDLLDVTDLLAHRAGLGTFVGDHLWFRRALTPKQVLTQVPHLGKAYPFRAGYGYSNIGFVAAGEVLREVTGQSWGTFAKARLWGPLGMTRTVASVSELPSFNVATGHITRQNNRPIHAVNWDLPGAAGGTWSTVHDMLRWARVSLGRGVIDGDTIYPAAVQREVWRPRNAVGGPPAFSGYGLGYFVMNVDGHFVATHGGGYDGMYSQFLLLPDDGVGIVVLTNSMTGAASAVARKIADLYIGRAAEDWLDRGLAHERASDSTWFARQDSVEYFVATRATGERDAFAKPSGRYIDGVYGAFEIAADEGGALVLSWPRAPALDAVLEPLGGDVYRLRWREPQAWFDSGVAYLEPGGDGAPVLRLYLPGDDIFYDTIAARRE